MAQSIVFDNGVGGAKGIDDALQSDADPLPEFNNIVEIAADDFMVNADTVITNVHWAGVYVLSNTPSVDDFQIRIYADNGGPTGSPIASFNVGNDVNRSDSGADFMTLFDIYEYSATIKFEAAANVTYWLSIDAQSFADDNDTWFWGSLSTSGNAYTSPNIGVSWSKFGQATTMVLQGAPPTGDLLGDVNCDNEVNLLDIAPFVELLSNGGYSNKADINQDDTVDLLDVAPFVDLIGG